MPLLSIRYSVIDLFWSMPDWSALRRTSTTAAAGSCCATLSKSEIEVLAVNATFFAQFAKMIRRARRTIESGIGPALSSSKPSFSAASAATIPAKPPATLFSTSFLNADCTATSTFSSHAPTGDRGRRSERTSPRTVLKPRILDSLITVSANAKHLQTML